MGVVNIEYSILKIGQIQWMKWHLAVQVLFPRAWRLI